MGFYDRHVLPRLLDFSCGMKAIRKQREKVVPRARGRVLEVGIGSGLNLPHYDRSRVQTLIGLDPSPELSRIAERRARELGIAVEWLPLQAERIPLADHSIDTIVMTYTLCTIDEPALALAELRRVLAPGGVLLFSEHGRAPDAGVARTQQRLTPYWRRIAGGCRLDREVPALLAGARFELADLQTMYLPRTPRALGHTFWGAARVPD